jgi:hypothetical protein
VLTPDVPVTSEAHAEFVLERDGGSEMNHYSGMAMAWQRQAEFQREASLHRQVRPIKTEAPDRTTRFPRLLGFRRAGRSVAEASRARREWRFSRS